ncbi:MAG: FAD-binding oxidoreductase [Candidatus Limnocylindrales bacterium]
MLDLRDMDRLEIDPATRTAWAEPGVLAGDFTRAAHEHDLAMSFGDTGTVGIGGLTLGGGIGWLVRKHGLTIDSLLAVEIVTADGTHRTASAQEDVDLFWALRGGGGNFGVATRFKFQLHPVGPVLFGTIVMRATREVLAGLVPAVLSAPDELTLMSAIMPIPPIDEIDAKLHGSLGVLIGLMWAGPVEDGHRALEQIRSLGEPLFEDVAEQPYTAAYPPRASNRDPWTSRSIFLPMLGDEVIDIITRRMAGAPSPSALVHVRTLGGAVSRIAPDATAYGWRDRPMLLWIIADFTGGEPADLPLHERWAADFLDELRPLGEGSYVNFTGAAEGPEAARSSYPARTWDRLRTIKARYDPSNIFAQNENIPPA